jgi:hypothetical protein
MGILSLGANVLVSSIVRDAVVLFAIGWNLASCGTSVLESVNEADAVDSASAHPAPETGTCVIEATNYDQSCMADTDCVGTANSFPVESGNYCKTMCLCGGDAINKSAVAQYVHDVSMTPLGSGPTDAWGDCLCEAVLAPCCVKGLCTTLCPGVLIGVEDAQAAQDAQEVPLNSVMCNLNVGPFDAGTDAGGPWRWCAPPASCVPFNGGWACCILPDGGPTGGPTFCSAPLAEDAGG